jgi:hypothetical protein
MVGLHCHQFGFAALYREFKYLTLKPGAGSMHLQSRAVHGIRSAEHEHPLQACLAACTRQLAYQKYDRIYAWKIYQQISALLQIN